MTRIADWSDDAAMADEEGVKRVFEVLQPVLNERMRRLVAAAQAQALGRGGVTRVARATGFARVYFNSGEMRVFLPLSR